MKRFVVVLTVWAMGLAGVLASVVFPSAASAATPTEAGAYGSVAPSRLLDTRIGVGAVKAAVAPFGTVALQVTGKGNVPATGVSAVVLNVTVVAPAKAGFITVFGAGKARPVVSNLNFLAGQTVPNLVIAPVGAGGKVNLFNGSAGGTFLIADVTGYYLSGAPTNDGAFGSVAPIRMLDTRTGLGAAKTQVPSNGTVDLQVAGRGGVPAGVSAVVLNVTATGSTKNGAITVFGQGTTRPGTSNLNFAAGQTVPNLVIAPVSASGKVSLYNDSLGRTSVIADAFGYFRGGAGPVTAGAYGSVVPERLLDTRDGTGIPGNLAAAVAANGSVNLKVTGSGVPANASAVVLNVTATQPAQAGFITVFAADAAKPLASNLNFLANKTVPNLVIAPVGANGEVTLFNGSTGTTHLLADVAGYYLDDDLIVGTGSVSGTVTESGGTGLADVQVMAFALSTGDSGYASTVADGSYTVPGLPAGADYLVCFDPSGATGGSSDASGYVAECFDNQPASGRPTPVVVTADATTGVNATLAAGGAISGVVTDSGGTGLADVQVGVYAPSTGHFGYASTVTGGGYTVPGLPAGADYQVCFYASGATGGSSDATGYVAECFDNQSASGTPTPVVVTVGTTRIGTSAALAAGGAISGAVTDAGGRGLMDVQVSVYDPSTGAGGDASTGPGGSYTVPGLPAGADYQVCFYAFGATGGSSDATGYLEECFDNQPASGTPTPVVVTVGTTRAGTNAVLAAKP